MPSPTLLDRLPVDGRILQFFVVAFAGWLNRHQTAQLACVTEENRVLRQHLGKRRLRLTDAQRRRLAAKAKAVGRRGLLQLSTIVTPDTLMRWYRRLVAQKYDGSKRRGPGRPRTPRLIADLIIRLANENPSWGYTRIRGNLAILGHKIGRSTIARILAEHGIDPAPQRPMQWSTFLRAHWGVVCAADFFTVEVLTPLGLSRRHVLFVIDLETRAVEIAGIVAEPGEQWVVNMVRGLLDQVDGFLLGKRYLILDRDPVFTKRVRQLLGSAGVEVVRLPARSPNLNAYAERFIGSVRQECLSKIIPLGDRHLRHILKEYVAHYHAERPHQGIGNRLLCPAVAANGPGPIKRRQRLGGVLNFYSRAA